MRPAHASLAVLAAMTLSPSALAAPRGSADGHVDVALLFDGEWPANAPIDAALRQALTDVVSSDAPLRFPETLTRTGDWTVEGIGRELDALLADPAADLVITAGLVGTQLATRKRPDKPLFAILVVDAAIQDLPTNGKSSGVRNLNYLSAPTSITSDLAELDRLVPGADHVAVLVTDLLAEAVGAGLEKRLKASAPEGTTVDLVPVGADAEAALAGIGDGVDVVYLTPLPELPDAERDLLAAGLRTRRLPSFAMYGEDWVARGVLAARPLDALLPVLTRRLGVHVDRTLRGSDPGSLPLLVDARPGLVLNVDTARAIGASPTWGLVFEATPYSAAGAQEGAMSLAQAALAALEANLSLSASAQEVEAGAGSVVQARSPLLPQLAIGASARVLDADRARAALGLLPQFRGDAQATLSQIVVSEDAFAGNRAERLVQGARESVFDAREADTVQLAAQVYLLVLRARAVQEVERSNLDITRKNLELARVRLRVGSASPSEIYRWDVERTVAERRLLAAAADTRAAEYAFNQVLNRPLDAPVLLSEGVDAAADIAEPELLEPLGNPFGLSRMAEFLVEQGLERSPEVAAARSALAAQERLRDRARRSYWVPDIGLYGTLGVRMFAEGEGKPGSTPGVESPDVVSFEAGAQASLPLFEGLRRRGEVQTTSAEVTRLSHERDLASQQVDQRIRTALVLAASSYQAMSVADEGAESAARNLDAITAAYSLGSVSILELLDAQGASLTARIAATDARYVFRLDIVELMRAGYRFSFLETPEERAAFTAGIEAWMAAPSEE